MKSIEQWTVVELREELKARGLTTGGLKGELYERLRGALESEPPGAATPNPPRVSRSRRATRRASGVATATQEQIPAPEAGEKPKGRKQRKTTGGTTVENGQEEKEEEEEVEEEEQHRSGLTGADIQVGVGRTGLEEETGLSGGQEEVEEGLEEEEEEEEETGVGSEEDEDGDLVFKKPEEVGGTREEEVGVNPDGMEETDLVGEEEGDDLLANEDLDAMETEKRGGGADGAQMAVEQADTKQIGKSEVSRMGMAKTPEWREVDIPRPWLPMPLIRVKDISEDSDLEALREVLTQAWNEIEIHSVHIDTSVEGAPPSALVRLVPPWSAESRRASLDGKKSQDSAGNGMQLKNGEGGGLVQSGEAVQDDGKAKANQIAEIAEEPKTIGDAAGDVGDVKKSAEFCVQKLQAAGVKLGESVLEFEAPIVRTTLFVHNLREEYGNDDKKFSDDLSQHGELLRCFCVHNKDGMSKDYGFVEYALPRDAAQAKNVVDSKSSEALQRFRDAKMNAMQGDHGSILPEKRLRCEWSFNQTVPSLFSKICYISNLPVGFMDREALRVVFEPYGEIISCNIRSRAGMGPGCGFVEFAHGRDAERAMLDMNGTHAPSLGYILVSLVNPAKFPGDTAGTAFQRMGGFVKRPRPDFMPNRGRGFGRPFVMDPRSRGMVRGRGRGRGGPMQPQYAYGQYQYYGGYQPQGYQSGYYGGGYPYGQGSGYHQYYPQHSHYRSGSSSPHHGGYKSSQYSGHGSWGQGEGGKGGGGYGYGGDHGYGQQSGYSQGYSGGNNYQSGSYSGYGSQGYGGSGYGGGHQSHSHSHYSGGNSSYQSGYGQYHGGGYQGPQNYGLQSYGSQEYGSGYGQSGFDHGSYEAHAGDKRVADYGGDYPGQMGQESKRPRY